MLRNHIKDLEISQDSPWLLQQFLKGPEYASYSIVSKGKASVIKSLCLTRLFCLLDQRGRLVCSLQFDLVVLTFASLVLQVVAHVDNVAELSCLNYAHAGLPEVCVMLVVALLSRLIGTFACIGLSCD